MKMEMVDEHGAFPKECDKWTHDGLEVVELKFLKDEASFKIADSYNVEMVYQHFGQNETIYGYKDLKVVLNFTSSTLKFWPEVIYSEKYRPNKADDVKPDDIVALLREQMPADQKEMLLNTRADFESELRSQKTFRPYGNQIQKFQYNDETFELFRLDQACKSSGGDRYVERAQAIAMFFIESLQYTDEEDPNFNHYFLFELKKSDEGKDVYTFVGYSSVYEFYHYPESVRTRISQFFISPPYRKGGFGAVLLQSIYRDLWNDRRVFDMTVEVASENFTALRDYTDCINCMSLEEFSKENLMKGYAEGMYEAARKKFKLGKLQVRRVYEILRLRVTNQKNDTEMKEFRIDVKRRLESMFRKKDQEWARLKRTLNTEEFKQVAALTASAEQKMATLQKVYTAEVEPYMQTILRLAAHPSIGI